MNLLKYIYQYKTISYWAIRKEIYDIFKLPIKIFIILNKNYKLCEIYRNGYKLSCSNDHHDIVVVGLRPYGENIKKRTYKYAKEYLETHEHARCPYCGIELTNKNVTVDHIISFSYSKTNSKVNFVTCCRKCNREKGSMDYKKFLKLKKLDYKKIF